VGAIISRYDTSFFDKLASYFVTLELPEEKSDVARFLDFAANFICKPYSLVKNQLLGLHKLPEKISVFRVISAKSIDFVDIEKPGIHWTPSFDVLNNPLFLEWIRIDCNNLLFLLSTEIAPCHIDFPATIVHRYLFAHECELTLKERFLHPISVSPFSVA